MRRAVLSTARRHARRCAPASCRGDAVPLQPAPHRHAQTGSAHRTGTRLHRPQSYTQACCLKCASTRSPCMCRAAGKGNNSACTRIRCCRQPGMNANVLQKGRLAPSSDQERHISLCKRDLCVSAVSNWFACTDLSHACAMVENSLFSERRYAVQFAQIAKNYPRAQHGTMVQSAMVARLV